MLHSETKRKIDNARDILVGKIPVPSEQIELITIALIYKFMSDIDEQNKEFGSVGFFVGEYEKYSWPNLMDRKLGAHDRLYLYSEGLEKMGTNPHLPQMFRDIFRNAFLPFRAPQTLDRFLKQIGEFTYDHSEELGNAFEYLLSTAGSQGEAGMFRTPRHIIDFIVKIVEPKHTDTILDPACGTAGFLISAYKYILSSNTQKTLGDQLTLAQKNKLADNFVGYDISHQMVRLSLVNLYLHNFGDPKIFEYDTLSSDERREERFDCILANPPFMTPKGGIQPHNRFSVKASKSEVLFVDYMMDHLNPNGKAGIIVPEGIIFQSANAYKSLRQKMIIENYLRAVVSLPSGVFQPYAGVKTSVLLFDKELAKKTDNILFVKINQDGFDLGAQRRPTPEKDDLPGALKQLLNYKRQLANGQAPSEWEGENILLVSKNDIETNEFNLSMERYRPTEIINSDWPMVELGEVCEILDNLRKPIRKGDRIEGEYPYYGATGIVDYIDDYIFDEKLVLIGEDGAKWGIGDKTAFIAEGKYWVNNHAHVIKPDRSKLLDELLVELINNIDLQRYITGITVPKLNQQNLKSIQIPLPPLAIQEQIVAELDGYQKIIDGAQQIVENYKPTIKIDPDWPIVELGEVCEVNKKTGDPKTLFGKSEFTYIDISSVKNGTGEIDFRNIIKTGDAPSRARRIIKKGDILLSTVRPNLKAFGYLNSIPEKVLASTGFAVLSSKEKLVSKFLYYLIFNDFVLNQMIGNMGKGSYPSINQKDVEFLKIPLPPLAIQEQIVAQIEKEQAMVDSAKNLIEIFESKIKEKIGEVWGE